MAKPHSVWEPILAHKQNEMVAIIEAIDAGMPDLSTARNGISLAQGAAGFAIYYGYRIVHKIGPFHSNEERMLFHLEKATERLDRTDASLFSGYPGVAWAIDHLQALGLVDAADDLNEQVDAHLLAQLEQGFPHGLTELIQGLAGVGVYALGRGGRGRGEALLDGVVRAMAHLARIEPSGTTWLTRPEALPEWQGVAAPDGYYNLGLAHGIGGLIKEVIDDLSEVNGGNTYGFGCDGNGTLTYRRATACISTCTKCPAPGGGSTAISNQSRFSPNPCMCKAC